MSRGEARRGRHQRCDRGAWVEAFDELFEDEHATCDGCVERGREPGRGTAGDQDAQVGDVASGERGDDDGRGTAHLDRRALAAQGQATANRQQTTDVFDRQNPEPVWLDAALGDRFDTRNPAPLGVWFDPVYQGGSDGRSNGADQNDDDHPPPGTMRPAGQAGT